MSKWRHVGLLVAGFLALSAPTSFGAESHEGTLSSVVLINRNGGAGSGVYIGDGRVVTAAHVVGKNDDDDKQSVGKVFVTVSRNDAPAESVGAKVIGFDPREDIALLKLDLTIPGLPAAKLACRVPVVGEQIETVGNPLGQTFIHTWGRVAGVMRDEKPWPHAVPIDLNIAPGNSGGPVYDKDGNVLGLAVGLAYGGDGEKVVQPGTVSIMVSALPLCQHLGLMAKDDIAGEEHSGAPVVVLAKKTKIADQATPACQYSVANFLVDVAKDGFTIAKFEGDDYLKYVAAYGKVLGRQIDPFNGNDAYDAVYVLSKDDGEDIVFIVLAKSGCASRYTPVLTSVNDKVLDAMKAAS